MNIKIEIRDDIPPTIALSRVREVVSGGRVSNGRGIKHYCWATLFSDNIGVVTRGKRKKNSADSFIVYQVPKSEDVGKVKQSLID